MSTVFAFLLGAVIGLQLHLIVRSIKPHLSQKQLSNLMLSAHVGTAFSILGVVLSHSREIAGNIAVFLSDYLGVWIIKYTAQWMYPLAGHLGTLAKALFDYVALADPMSPALQALAIYACAQMLVFEFLSREKK
jgi:hypothetical protein